MVQVEDRGVNVVLVPSNDGRKVLVKAVNTRWLSSRCVAPTVAPNSPSLVLSLVNDHQLTL
jgi:hypothetical protein